MDAFTDPKVERVTFMKSARVGYALSLDTPIPTASGWTTMGDVKAGDVLFDELGRQCSVRYTSPVYYDHECFEVEFCDGSTIVADKGHRWFVQSDVSFEHLRGGLGAGRTGRPRPGQKATKQGVVDTGELALILKTSRGRSALAVPVALQLDLPDAYLPVPPYTLGLWLGDGHMVSPRITQHRSDVETARYIEAEGIKVSVQYTDARYPDNATYFLDCEGGRANPSPWSMKLRRLGVLNNKHIPAQYLRAGTQQRLQLLRGLMDSDGNSTGNSGNFSEFTNTSKALADGVFELVVSLGMKAHKATRKPKQPHHLLQYRVVFRASPTANPFNLSRKAASITWPQKPTITTRRRIVAVRPCVSVPVRCIEVDSASHLFLAGRSMIPTHNTKCLNWVIAYHMHQDPCSILCVQPTIDDAQGYSKDEIAPMVRDVPVLQGLVSEGYRDSSNTILKKLFPGGSLNLVGANSARGFRRLTCRVVLFDEVDGYPPTAGDEGDQIALGIRRSDTFWNRKIAIGSTPTIAGLSRVERSYAASDMRRYYIPCPHCHAYQYLKWAQMKWPENDPARAYYVCEECQQPIDHQHKRWMVERGEWRSTAPFNGHAGFHLWAAYSYSPNATWAKLAEEWVAAQSDREALKTFVNTVLGEPWAEKGETVSHAAIYERRENYKSPVPNGSVITAGVDVQDDRLEVDLVAWGDGEECWSVEYLRLYGDPSRAELWDELRRRLSTTWLRSDGAQIECRCVCIDSGGHYTDEVYAFSRKVGVRWAVPIKGSTEPGKPVASFPRTLNQKRVYLTHIGTDTAKELIYRRLKQDEPGPGYMHFPMRPEFDSEYFQQLTAEKAVTKYRNGRPYVQWEKLRPRNEALDCRVYALAAVRILQQHGGIVLETVDPDAPPPEPKPEPPKPQPFIRRPESPRQGAKSWFGNYRR